ncbi:MAG: DUF1351 domain-containing protein [Bacilli bacterium]|nr:DUF1351 domain-containing protein [Bacilli bacterium]
MEEEKLITIDLKSENNYTIANYDELKNEIINICGKYDQVEINATNYYEIKQYKAKLNNLEDKLASIKSELRNKALAPLEKGMKQIDELRSYIKVASNKLNDSVKEIDARADKEKRETISDYYLAKKCPVNFKYIWEDKWLNKTSQLEEIYQKIDTKVDKINDDLKVIKKLGKSKEDIKFITYLYCEWNLPVAECVNQLEIFHHNCRKKSKVVEAKEDKIKGIFTIEATREQLNDLLDYMVDSNIHIIESKKII